MIVLPLQPACQPKAAGHPKLQISPSRAACAKITGCVLPAADAYAECYPSYYEYAGTVVDSDEEEGGDRREGADKGVGLSRFDFGSEEEYREYLAAILQRAAAGAAGGGKGDTRRAKVLRGWGTTVSCRSAGDGFGQAGSCICFNWARWLILYLCHL